jgi:hypothetical protein
MENTEKKSNNNIIYFVEIKWVSEREWIIIYLIPIVEP